MSCFYSPYVKKMYFCMGKTKKIVIWSFLLLVMFGNVSWAEYKPADVSNIKGKQRMELTELVKKIKQMPAGTADCYVCEQLGLFFKKDGAAAMRQLGGRPGIYQDSLFVGRTKRLSTWIDAVNKLREGQWVEIYSKTVQFKPEVPLYFFAKGVTRIVQNTAKYLLKNMPAVTRQALLASIGRMIYKTDGAILSATGYGSWTRLDCGIVVKYNGNTRDGYCFMNPEGRECSLQEAFAADPQKQRWRDMVRRCENLIGAQDILALFPEEVEAMSKHYRGRKEQLKEQREAAGEALLAAADEMLDSCPEKQKYSKIAAAMGLYFSSHEFAGYNYTYGWLNPGVIIYLPSGERLTSHQDIVDNSKPGILQQIPHEMILEHYAEPISQMARRIAEDRFKQMPPLLRELARAWLTRTFIKADGSPEEDIKERHFTIETFSRKWVIPAVDARGSYFIDSRGKKWPFNLIDQFGPWLQTRRLVVLCSRILGREEVLQYIPPAKDGEQISTAESAQNTAMGSTSLEGQASQKTAQYAAGREALRKMPVDLRRAWLAEVGELCYAQGKETAYKALHVADEEALFVDSQGRERKISEAKTMTDEATKFWTVATEAAQVVGYEMLVGPYKKELKDLAVQTATHILSEMPEEVRYSWLSEANKLLFQADGKFVYPPNRQSSTSGCVTVQRFKVSYDGKLYYSPQGQIKQAQWPEWNTWGTRWYTLFRCENLAGIDAINASFKTDVDAMRAAYEKSPFRRK